MSQSCGCPDSQPHLGDCDLVARGLVSMSRDAWLALAYRNPAAYDRLMEMDDY